MKPGLLLSLILCLIVQWSAGLKLNDLNTTTLYQGDSVSLSWTLDSGDPEEIFLAVQQDIEPFEYKYLKSLNSKNLRTTVTIPKTVTPTVEDGKANGAPWVFAAYAESDDKNSIAETNRFDLHRMGVNTNGTTSTSQPVSTPASDSPSSSTSAAQAGTTTATESTTGQGTNETKKTPVGAIVGGVLGGVFAILLLLGLFLFCRRRQRQRQTQRTGQSAVDPFDRVAEQADNGTTIDIASREAVALSAQSGTHSLEKSNMALSDDPRAAQQELGSRPESMIRRLQAQVDGLQAQLDGATLSAAPPPQYMDVLSEPETRTEITQSKV